MGESSWGVGSNLRNLIVGIDEVGMSALAGPVVACALYFVSNPPFEIQESKQLNEAGRLELYEKLKPYICYACGAVSAKELRYWNLHQADMIAMGRAYSQLYLVAEPEIIICDGKYLPASLQGKGICEIRADEKYPVVAAASIVAKVTRDHIMRKLHNLFPQYDWSSNKGYPSPKHWQALENYGLTPHHRIARFRRLSQFK